MDRERTKRSESQLETIFTIHLKTHFPSNGKKVLSCDLIICAKDRMLFIHIWISLWMFEGSQATLWKCLIENSWNEWNAIYSICAVQFASPVDQVYAESFWINGSAQFDDCLNTKNSFARTILFACTKNIKKPSRAPKFEYLSK